jgi:hypothetical protein
MATAYEIAKAGGRHSGLYRRFSKERTALIEKSIRSLEKMLEEHQSKINDPTKYVSPDISQLHLQNLINHYWPEEIENFRQQIEVLTGLLKERNHEQPS